MTIIALFIALILGYRFGGQLQFLERYMGVVSDILLISIGVALAHTKIGNVGALFALYICLSLSTIIVPSLVLMRTDFVRSTIAGNGVFALKSTLVPIAWVLLGMVLGYIGVPTPPDIWHIAWLCALLLLVGVGLYSAKLPFWRTLFDKKGMKIALIFMPCVLLCGALVACIFAMPWQVGASLVAGFGWYSLSGVMLQKSLGADLALVALMVDLTREMVAFLGISVFMRYSPSAAVALGGATSLDFTLPIIVASGGKQVLPTALSFGLIINISAPILLYFLPML